jgi:site-specific DNA-methyltransferase (adenine-specific)
MKRRKKAFEAGLRALKSRGRKVASTRGGICALRPGLYDGRGMLDLNKIIHGDSIKELNDAEPGWVDLCFADPPFNIGYLYDGYDDEKKCDDYLKWSEEWMRAVHRALKPNGSFYLAIGDEYAADLCVLARRNVKFHLRNWIIWHYTFGQQTSKKFAKSHTHILYFTKSENDFTFNADAVRVASARQTTYADKRANSKGKLPDDTWFLRPQEAAPHGYFEAGQDTWCESRVCGTFKEREGWHGCQMPIGVLNRIILASSNKGDVVLDPFNGSGTTVVAASLLDRKYVGIDQSDEYVGYARKRLAHALELKDRAVQATTATPVIDIRTIADPKRASKVVTGTDAFGRPRVARRARSTAKKSA